MERIIKEFRDNPVFMAALGLLFVYFLYKIQIVLMLLLIAFIIVVALHPIVKRIQKFGLPRAIATLVTVLAVFSVLGGLFYLIYDETVEQIDTFNISITDALNRLPFSDTFQVNFSLQPVTEQLFGSTSQIFSSVALTFVSLVAGVTTVLVISIYWLSDYSNIKKTLLSQFKNRKMGENMYGAVEKRLGGWVRGQLIISLVIGVLSYIVYQVLGLPAALALAVIAGLLEVIPTLGPVLAAIPAVLIAFTISPELAFITLLANVGIQQLENHLIAPKILQYTAKLHPIVIILVLYIGSQLAGLLGILLAVPFTLLLLSLRHGYLDSKRPTAKA